MAKSVLLVPVESRPESTQLVHDYHKWHDDVHIPEMLTIGGFSSARRWRSEDGQTFITLYAIDADVDTAKAALRAAFESGRMSKPVAVEVKPPPVMRYFSLVSGASQVGSVRRTRAATGAAARRGIGRSGARRADGQSDTTKELGADLGLFTAAWPVGPGSARGRRRRTGSSVRPEPSQQTSASGCPGALGA
jgi:hypothetical protein